MKLNKKKILGELYKEFKTLEKGKELEFVIQPQIKPVKLKSKLYWRSDTKADYGDPLVGGIPDQVYESLDEGFNKALEPELKKFNKHIKDFIEKSDSFAGKLGEDKHEFFESMMDYGRTQSQAAYFKTQMKKEIRLAEKNLEKLKRKLQNGI